MKSTMYLPLNSYKDKEATEWSNFWYDQANVRGGAHRILLVGDSIARQYRRGLSEKLKCPVDLFGTSAALRDSMFWDQCLARTRMGMDFSVNMIISVFIMILLV